MTIPAVSDPSRLLPLPPATSSNSIPLLAEDSLTDSSTEDATIYDLSLRGRASQARRVRRRSSPPARDPISESWISVPNVNLPPRTDLPLVRPFQPSSAREDRVLFDEVWSEYDSLRAANNPPSDPDEPGRMHSVRSYAQALRTLLASTPAQTSQDDQVYTLTCSAKDCNSVLCYRGRAPFVTEGRRSQRLRHQSWRYRTWSTDATPVESVVPWDGEAEYMPESAGNQSPHCKCKAVRTGCRTWWVLPVSCAPV
jgi:hypothetical protein